MVTVYFVSLDDISNLSSRLSFNPCDFVEKLNFENDGEVQAFIRGLERMKDDGWALVRVELEAIQIAKDYFDEYMAE